MKFAFKRVTSPVAVCAVSTMAGTRNEDPALNGLAHLNEHMLFKGTEKRGAASINNVLENVGGELNAYTTKEETVVHATVLKEDLKRAIDLLLEMVFTSTYPEKELVKEREVVYEEIISYKDSPADSIYEDFESRIFEGHPLQNPILGTRKSLARIESSTLKEYLHKWFVPDNMAITVVADMDEGKVVRIVERALQKYCPGEHCINVPERSFTDAPAEDNSALSAGDATEMQPAWSPRPAFTVELQKKHHQAHCVIGTAAYSYNKERKRLALALLANILGGPAMNARLNTVLRERNALVYSVEACFNPYKDTGLFTIYFGCDKPLVERCLTLVRKELDRLVDRPLSSRELTNAKKQLLGQLAIASDNSEAQCLSMGKSVMVFGAVEPQETTRRKIESLTAGELQQVAQEIFPWEKLSRLIYR